MLPPRPSDAAILAREPAVRGDFAVDPNRFGLHPNNALIQKILEAFPPPQSANMAAASAPSATTARDPRGAETPNNDNGGGVGDVLSAILSGVRKVGKENDVGNIIKAAIAALQIPSIGNPPTNFSKEYARLEEKDAEAAKLEYDRFINERKYLAGREDAAATKEYREAQLKAGRQDYELRANQFLNTRIKDIITAGMDVYKDDEKFPQFQNAMYKDPDFRLAMEAARRGDQDAFPVLRSLISATAAKMGMQSQTPKSGNLVTFINLDTKATHNFDQNNPEDLAKALQIFRSGRWSKLGQQGGVQAGVDTLQNQSAARRAGALSAEAAEQLNNVTLELAQLSDLEQEIRNKPGAVGYSGRFVEGVLGALGSLEEFITKTGVADWASEEITGLSVGEVQEVRTKIHSTVAGLIPEVTGEESGRITEQERQLASLATGLNKPGASFQQIMGAIAAIKELKIFTSIRLRWESGQPFIYDFNRGNKEAMKQSLERLERLGIKDDDRLAKLAKRIRAFQNELVANKAGLSQEVIAERNERLKVR